MLRVQFAENMPYKVYQLARLGLQRGGSLRTVCFLSSFQSTFSSSIRRLNILISTFKYTLKQTVSNVVLYILVNLVVFGFITVDSLPRTVYF
jgi:hypothetical protein